MTRTKRGTNSSLSLSAPDERPIALLFDRDLMRPACILLQVAARCDQSAFMRLFGGSDKWLVAPTPGMKIYSATKEQWEKVARRVEVKT